MLHESDKRWLREAYPGLFPTGNKIVGTIEFRASYDRQCNRFFILGSAVTEQKEAVALSGAFQIRIEKRTDASISRLPALYVEGVEAAPDRHFNQADKSACLCSPLEEDEFLGPELQFRAFLEQLVVPFLYGQIYYSSKGHWPWAEYAHGATGILEAYARVRDQNRAEECLRLVSQDANWPRIQSALRQKTYIKGHTPCFCSRRDQIRRCHPGALEGALRLQQDLRALGISVP